MNKKPAAKIERIMEEAFDRAATVLCDEVRSLIVANPQRYSRFVLAVGWGPTLFGADRKIVPDERLCARGRRLMAYATDFYDRYGGDNRQVTAPPAPRERSEPPKGFGELPQIEPCEGFRMPTEKEMREGFGPNFNPHRDSPRERSEHGTEEQDDGK